MYGITSKMFAAEIGLVVLLAAVSSSLSRPPTAASEAEKYGYSGDLNVFLNPEAYDLNNPNRARNYQVDQDTLSRTTAGRRLAFARLNSETSPFPSNNFLRASTVSNNAFLGNTNFATGSGYLANRAIIGYPENTNNVAYPSNTAAYLSNQSVRKNTDTAYVSAYPINPAYTSNTNYPTITGYPDVTFSRNPSIIGTKRFNVYPAVNTGLTANSVYQADQSGALIYPSTAGALTYPSTAGALTDVQAYPSSAGVRTQTSANGVLTHLSTAGVLTGHSSADVQRYPYTAGVLTHPSASELIYNNVYTFPSRTAISRNTANPAYPFVYENNALPRRTLFNANPFPVNPSLAYASQYSDGSQLSSRADGETGIYLFPASTSPLAEANILRSTSI